METKEDLCVHADPELMLSALEQLFHNAREAMPDGGSFTIRVHREGAESVVLHAIDSGRGIAVEPVARVFEPFFSSGVPHGAGLGLAIVEKIIQLHQGTVSAANRADATGAVITITLPAV
jgi:signal transduction histidine kinase